MSHFVLLAFLFIKLPLNGEVHVYGDDGACERLGSSPLMVPILTKCLTYRALISPLSCAPPPHPVKKEK